MKIGLNLAVVRTAATSGGASLADYAVGGVSPATVLDFKNDVYLGTVDAFTDVSLTGSAALGTTVGEQRLEIPTPGTDYATLAAAKLPVGQSAYTIVMLGEETHADNGTGYSASALLGEIVFFAWYADASNYMEAVLRTDSTRTGQVYSHAEVAAAAASANSAATQLPPATQARFGLACRYGPTTIYGATSGTLFAAENAMAAGVYDTTGSDLLIGYNGGAGSALYVEHLLIFTEALDAAGLQAASAAS